MTCYLQSAVWCSDVYDLTGPRASGNVRHAEMLCYVIVEWIYVVAPKPPLGGGLLSTWILRERENGCLYRLLTLFEQSEDSLDQLLIKDIKTSAKVTSV